MRIACLATVLAAIALAPAGAMAQPHPKAAPPGPYKQVVVTLPKPYGDASLDAFRKELGDIAKRKDRAALAGKVVAKGFFWQREDSNDADPKKSGIDNLADAMALDASDGTGWQALAADALDATAAPQPEMKNVVCSPALPTFSEEELEKVAQSTKTDPSDWAYPAAPGVEVRAKGDAGAPVVDKLGTYFVRILPDESPDAATGDWIKIVTAGGKVGYVPGDSLSPIGSDQICYSKEGGAWRIAGYIGGGGGQE